MLRRVRYLSLSYLSLVHYVNENDNWKSFFSISRSLSAHFAVFINENLQMFFSVWDSISEREREGIVIQGVENV